MEGEGKYSTELWSEEAVNTIQDLANSSHPWFLQVHWYSLETLAVCNFLFPGVIFCTQGTLPGKKILLPNNNHFVYTS